MKLNVRQPKTRKRAFIGVRVTEEQFLLLKRAAEKAGLTPSGLVRRALDRLLRRAA